MKDSGFAAIGTRYYRDDRNYFDAYFDYRQPASAHSAPQREVSLYYGYRTSRTLRFEAYVLKGYSESSPDRGVGARLSYYF